LFLAIQSNDLSAIIFFLKTRHLKYRVQNNFLLQQQNNTQTNNLNIPESAARKLMTILDANIEKEMAKLQEAEKNGQEQKATDGVL
jgi:hypothetical protein